MGPALSIPYQVSMFCWFALEIGLLVRDLVRGKGRRRRDRGTRLVVSLSLGGSVVFGILLRTWVPGLDVPGPRAWAVAGLVAIWAGLALRVWAVLALGASFRT